MDNVIFDRAGFTSFLAPTKFDLLFHLVISDSPLQAMHCCVFIDKLSVIISIESSKFTTLVVRQLNKTPHLYIWLLSNVFVRLYCFIVTDPKQSVPEVTNSSLITFTVSFGKFSICFSFSIQRPALKNNMLIANCRFGIHYPMSFSKHSFFLISFTVSIW